ncbi:uncharacterized protein HKW66_Vig0025540 [Vigna angularis]|uniref:Uncharacterized protein n=1 Tax=Phaseolus angularis TaxID=3914 RepID=A0A8T0L834_PHAAN|nr:uncharacterized protein HKW66_Vig0025540 [Vigna angularis]
MKLLGESANAWKGSWRLFGMLRSSPSPPWVFSFIHGGFSPFGVEDEDELRIGGADTNERPDTNERHLKHEATTMYIYKWPSSSP